MINTTKHQLNRSTDGCQGDKEQFELKTSLDEKENDTNDGWNGATVCSLVSHYVCFCHFWFFKLCCLISFYFLQCRFYQVMKHLILSKII